MKVKIAVLCFVILCTWYVYSVHNRCCPPTHNLYLLLCSYHWDIYEQPLSMIVARWRQSQTRYSGFPLCQDSSFTPMCAIFTAGLRALISARICSGIPCCRQWKKLSILARYYMPKNSIARKKIVTYLSSRLIQSSQPPLSVLTLCDDERVCSETAEVQMHVPLCWLL